MHMFTPREVKEAFGEIDDLTVAEIVAIGATPKDLAEATTGATPQDLAEAPAWITNDEALVNAGRALADECLRLARAASTSCSSGWAADGSGI